MMGWDHLQHRSHGYHQAIRIPRWTDIVCDEILSEAACTSQLRPSAAIFGSSGSVDERMVRQLQQALADAAPPRISCERR